MEIMKVLKIINKKRSSQLLQVFDDDNYKGNHIF